jgi:hypothetical protein
MQRLDTLMKLKYDESKKILPCSETVSRRVARWYISKPKIPIWVNFGGPWSGWYSIRDIWYVLGPFGN